MAEVEVSDNANERRHNLRLYKYQPLPFPDSIRVLVLSPSNDIEGDLVCELCHVRLSHSKEFFFSALSYVWGEGGGDLTIQIESPASLSTPYQKYRTLLPVRKSLDNALRHLRRPVGPVRIWVDAVCIDQSSTLERNHQVQQMRDIYQSARKTIVYLGPAYLNGNTSHAAWNYLERKSSWAWDTNFVENWMLPAELERELVHFRGELEDVEVEILNRDWFRRVWVLQEVVVSKKVYIQSGRRRISWDDFCKILLLSPRYHDQYGHSLANSSKIEIVRQMFHARCTFLEAHGLGKFRPSWYSKVDNHHRGSSHVLEMLSRGRLMQASNAEDKIYALLGISTGFDLNDSRFAIDYSKSVVEIYTDFAKHMIESTGSFEVLSYVDEYGKHGLPSWVPNWDQSYWSNKHTSPTIIGTLPPESEVVQERRKHMVNNSHTFLPKLPPILSWKDGMGASFFILGSLLGRVKIWGGRIALAGKDELTFEEIHEQLSYNHTLQYQEIFATWANLRSERNRSKFVSLVSMEPNPPRASVEYHLFKRSRRTANWTNDANKSDDVIFDSSSIVDGKLLASYTSFIDPMIENLTILPPQTTCGDYIVSFRGARVPFVVRPTRKMFCDVGGISELNKEKGKGKIKGTGQEGKESLLDIHSCRLVGECVANGFRDFVTDEAGRGDSNSLMRNMQGFMIH